MKLDTDTYAPRRLHHARKCPPKRPIFLAFYKICIQFMCVFYEIQVYDGFIA
jgi:hypothetical protein